MESARCITRKAKVISSSENEKQSFASKPKADQKSSKVLLQHEPKPSLPPRTSNSKYCRQSTKPSNSSTTSGPVATVKKEDCINFIHAHPISSGKLNQSEIDGGNPPTVTSTQSCSFSSGDPYSLFPLKVCTKFDVFDISGIDESQLGGWNTSDFANADDIIPPPKSAKHFSDAFLPEPSNFQIPISKGYNVNSNLKLVGTYQNHTENCDTVNPSLKFNCTKLLPFSDVADCKTVVPSLKRCNVNSNLQSIDKLSSVKCESLVPRPKICDGKPFSLENCYSNIPSEKSCDSEPFFSFNTQTNEAAYELIIPPSNGCVSTSFIFPDQTYTGNCDTVNHSLKSNHVSSHPFSDFADYKTVLPSKKCLEAMSLKSENQNKIAMKDQTINTGDIFSGDYFDKLIVNTTLSNKSLNNSIREHSNNIPESPSIACQTNCIFPGRSQSDSLSIEPKSKFDACVNELTRKNDQGHLDFLNADPEKSSNDINPLLSKSSKSIDSGLGLLSKENLAVPSSDIPSDFSESELKVLPFTHKEEYSASLHNSEVDSREKQRIYNLIDELLGK